MCLVAECGDDSLHEGVEECDDGDDNADTANACRTDCKNPTCRDGIQDNGEQCDDGNDDTNDSCTNTCTDATCGDGIPHTTAEVGVVLTEECDDGNSNETDGCTFECKDAFCGDGNRRTDLPVGHSDYEECDDGAANSDLGACSTSCTIAMCGDDNLRVDITDVDDPLYEACDDGDQNSDTTPNACRIACEDPTCGDGVTDPINNETCDDSNVVTTDACIECRDATCGDGFVEAGVEECDLGDGNNSNSMPNVCRTTCELPSCGDDTIDDGEACDDGADNSDTNANACRTSCQEASCGDNVQDDDEDCDDANLDDTDSCTQLCEDAVCGDGHKRTDLPVTDPDYEACDDGNNDDTDGCTQLCELPRCGDGDVQFGEECDDGDALNSDNGACSSSCTITICGDGNPRTGLPVTDPDYEECDDGNTSNVDTCTNTCEDAECGDTFVQAGEEVCDDGNPIETDDCTTVCEAPRCGDGHIQLDHDEVCDEGSANADTGTCTTSCLEAVCGDGHTQLSNNEECDDGNLDNGDTCNELCQANFCEPGHSPFSEITSARREFPAPTWYTGDPVPLGNVQCPDGHFVTTIAYKEYAGGGGLAVGITLGCSPLLPNGGFGPELPLLPNVHMESIESSIELDCNTSNTNVCAGIQEYNFSTNARLIDGFRARAVQLENGLTSGLQEVFTSDIATAVASPFIRMCGTNTALTGIEYSTYYATVDFITSVSAITCGSIVSECRVDPICGNSFPEGDEECDDGNFDDLFCDQDCHEVVQCNECQSCGKNAFGFGSCDEAECAAFGGPLNRCKLVAGACQPNSDECAPECGNGFLEGDEQCDDGDTDNQDECTNACTDAICGDEIYRNDLSENEDGYEQCDDANTNNTTDNCTDECKFPACTDGHIQEGEVCDDGNQLNTDLCTNTCTEKRCGDTFTQPGEECDDGNSNNNDNCTNTCANKSCGDGFPQPGEQCDDGNDNNNDDCTNACTNKDCGDGFTQAGEECDDGNTIDTDSCTNACTAAFCGDGIEKVVDPTVSEEPILIGSVTDSVKFAGTTFRTAVAGNLLYIASFTANAVSIVDISNPATPTIIGSITDAVGLLGPRGIAVAGDHAYVSGYEVGGTEGRITVINIASPANPTIVSVFTDTQIRNLRGMAIKGNYLYAHGGVGGFNVVDITDPTNLSVVARIDNNLFRNPRSIVIEGDYAYTTTSNGKFTAVDISNPLAPIVSGDTGTSNNTRDVAVHGSYAYVVRQTTGNQLRVINIADPTNPFVENTLLDILLRRIDFIEVNGQYAFITGAELNTAYLRIVDISDPSSPVIATTTKDNANLDKLSSIIVAGKNAYSIDLDTDSVVAIDLGTFAEGTTEQCDEGDDNSDTGACTTECEDAFCGDGNTRTGLPVTDPDYEECDDANLINEDSCTNACRLFDCGDGFVQGTEQCDKGPLNSDENADACRENCTNPRCGDGVRDPILDEQCDEGADNSNDDPDACREDCQAPRCGDGVIDPSLNEECDDENNIDTDLCDNNCQDVPQCSDCTTCGVFGFFCTEQSCLDREVCSFDNGACTPSPAHCAAVCGNGIIELGEECDDINTVSGDGCSNICQIEDGWECDIAEPQPDAECTGSIACSAGGGCATGFAQCQNINQNIGTYLGGTCNPPAVSRPTTQVQSEQKTIAQKFGSFARSLFSIDADVLTAQVGGSQPRIIEVRTLSPTGPGSLEAAMQATGPRIAVFTVGGIIDLRGKTMNCSSNKDYCISNSPGLVIAGETAPSPGITIIGGGIRVRHSDVLIRHLRIRAGNASPYGSSNSVYVHYGDSNGVVSNVHLQNNSFSWAKDQNASTDARIFPAGSYNPGGVRDVVWDRNIFSEGLKVRGKHSHGLLIGQGSQDVTVSNNLFAHNYKRNPWLGQASNAMVVNNLIYNPEQQIMSTSADNPSVAGAKWNVINNTVIIGPQTKNSTKGMLMLVQDDIPKVSVYMKNNVMTDRSNRDLGRDWSVSLCRDIISPTNIPTVSCDPFKEYSLIPATDGNSGPITTQWRALEDNAIAYNQVENALLGTTGNRSVGARPWDRDYIDNRVISEVRSEGGSIPNTESDKGGYPTSSQLPERHHTLAAATALLQPFPEAWAIKAGFQDACPDSAKFEPGVCGCNTPDTDTDGDGALDCQETCDTDRNKTAPGVCGCGTPDTDSDGDGTPNCDETCDSDPLKLVPGACGCGVRDTDVDNDNIPDCIDSCNNSVDTDNDGAPDCTDQCDTDPNKTVEGICGCFDTENDTDGDSTPDCNDDCPDDPNKIEGGSCGCGNTETDANNNGVADCAESLCACSPVICTAYAGGANPDPTTVDPRVRSGYSICYPRVECGNGETERGEDCDNGTSGNSNTTPNACRENCKSPICGDGVRDTNFNEECDNGILYNSDTIPDACRTNCQLAACGDGVLDVNRGEVCDQGSANSNETANACRTNCLPAYCGDGVRDAGEECDDAMHNSDDAPNTCRSDCTNPICGDGVQDAGEECDYGDNANIPGCTASCRLDLCGNGVKDAGEECDDGNLALNDGCDNHCEIEDGWECREQLPPPDITCDNNTLCTSDNDCTRGFVDCHDPERNIGSYDTGRCVQLDFGTAAAPAPMLTAQLIAITSCGDGVIQPERGEQCESNFDCNSEISNGDICSGCTCVASTPVCGNGIIDNSLVEQCETGIPCLGGGTCANCECSTETIDPMCGNGRLDALEQCDLGIPCRNNAQCKANCQCQGREIFPECGDGNLDPGEQCEVGIACAGGVQCKSDCLCATGSASCGNNTVENGEQCERISDCPDKFGFTTVACTNSCECQYVKIIDQPAGMCECAPVFCSAYDNGANPDPTTVDPRTARGPIVCTKVSNCGDGVREQGEECDNGGSNSNTAPNACRTDCREAYCGDGVQDSGETCNTSSQFYCPDGCIVMEECGVNQDTVITLGTSLRTNRTTDSQSLALRDIEADLTCPSGSVMTTIAYKDVPGTDFVDALTIGCSPLNTNGTIGAEQPLLSNADLNGNTSSLNTVRCPAGQAIVNANYKGMVTTNVPDTSDGIGIICAPISDSGIGDARTVVNAADLNGNTRTAANVPCPVGTVMTGLAYDRLGITSSVPDAMDALAYGHCAPMRSQCNDASICGNGIEETGEECDDRNTANRDGCTSTCQDEFCTVSLGPTRTYSPIGDHKSTTHSPPGPRRIEQDIQCNAGEVVTKILYKKVGTQDRLDGVTLSCGRLNANGTIGSSSYLPNPDIDGGSRTQYIISCPTGSAFTMIDYSAGTSDSVDGVFGACTPISNYGLGNPGADIFPSNDPMKSTGPRGPCTDLSSGEPTLLTGVAYDIIERSSAANGTTDSIAYIHCRPLVVTCSENPPLGANISAMPIASLLAENNRTVQIGVITSMVIIMSMAAGVMLRR